MNRRQFNLLVGGSLIAAGFMGTCLMLDSYDERCRKNKLLLDELYQRFVDDPNVNIEVVWRDLENMPGFGEYLRDLGSENFYLAFETTRRFVGKVQDSTARKLIADNSYSFRMYRKAVDDLVLE